MFLFFAVNNTILHREVEDITKFEFLVASCFEIRYFHVLNRTFGNSGCRNERLALFNQNLVHRKVAIRRSERHNRTDWKSVCKFTHIHRRAEHIPTKGALGRNHSDAFESHVLAATAAVSSGFEIESVERRMKHAVVHIHVAHPSGSLASDGHSAGASLRKAISDYDVFRSLVHSQTVLGTARFYCKAVVAAGKRYILNQNIFRRFDVDTVCSKSLEAKVFEVMRLLHSGRFENAMAKLETLIRQKEEPTMLLGAFIASYLDIYRARAAVVSGLNAGEPAKYYDYKRKEFRLDNASRRGVRSWTMSTINSISI